MIFQAPFASLNPRFTVGSIIAEPLRIHVWGSRTEINDLVQELLEIVGPNCRLVDRYPHGFSGGQRQRIAVARVDFDVIRDIGDQVDSDDRGGDDERVAQRA